MILRDLFIPGQKSTMDIAIAGDRIAAYAADAVFDDPVQINFKNAIIFPGLINSHDHLDFDLFPQYGESTYTNYTQWGPYIQKHYKSEIKKVLDIPSQLRSRWGIYKNLLAGVTTVAHHGEPLEIENPLITVLQNAQSLHSVKFEKWWQLRLNNFLNSGRLCVIHTGEGTDGEAVSEVNKLLSWNFLNRKMVAVHGVAMTPKQAKGFEALIWCPVSNMFLLGRTAVIDELKSLTRICFGTDSTLTAGWNIWDHLREARNTEYVNDRELYEMVSSSPASLWEIESGTLRENAPADIVVAEANDGSWDSFYAVDPEKILLVLHRGEIRMFDGSLLLQLHIDGSDFEMFTINGRVKYVQAGLKELINEISGYGAEVSLPHNITVN